jgi:endonuclease/exonuclease/phosphatase family metal-dependent hydrolase
MPLTVLTYNIHGGIGMDGVLDLDRIADVVRASGADVVALQEVDRHRRELSGYVDQAGHLAGRLGMDLAYAACLDDEPVSPGGERAQYGTAVLSRIGLVDNGMQHLPCFDGSEQRGLLDVEVPLDGHAVRVLGTHLQWDREDERLAQAEAIVAALDERPTILLGDFNTEPGSPTHALIATRLVDAWDVAGDGPGVTFAAEPPPRRIDYVWLGGGLQARTAEVLDSVASDHSALRVVLELGRT